jgi:hypothetical protein
VALLVSPLLAAASAAASWGSELTPEMFGAVGDGTTDDTGAIQDAADNCANGERLRFMNKSYLVTSQINVPLGASLVGSASPILSGVFTSPIGRMGTRLVSDQAAFNFFKFGGRNLVSGFAFDAAATAQSITSGSVFDCTGIRDVRFDNINIQRCFRGIVVDNASRQIDPGCENIWVTNSIFQAYYDSAIYYKNCIGGIISNCFFTNMFAVFGRSLGVALNFAFSTSTIHTDHCIILGGYRGVQCIGGAWGSYMTVMDDNHFNMVSQGECTDCGWYFSHLINSSMRSCWAGSNDSHGILLENGCYDFRIDSCTAPRNAGHGININTTAGRGIRLRDNTVFCNSRGSTGTYNGIEVKAGASQITLDSNTCDNHDPYGLGNLDQNYGIHVGAGCDRIRVIGNDLTSTYAPWNNLTAGLLDESTTDNKLVQGNW